MTPRLLILCDPFTSPAYTPRVRCLCDYLSEQGWHIDLYTERGEPLPFEHNYPIHEITVYRTRSFAEWAVKSIASLLTDWRNRYFSRQVRRAIRGQQYDLVLCCTFSTFPLRAALDIARERRLPLHVDLRDIDEQAPNAQYQSHRQWWLRPLRRWYSNVNIRRRNKVLRQADSLSCVSPWHQTFLQQLNSHVLLIYNGFDEQSYYPQNRPAKQFTLTYVGRVYEQPMQDPTLLLEALREINLPLRVVWYTNDIGRQRIQQLAQQYGVEQLMDYRGYVPTQDVPDILRSASVLLVLCNTAATSGAHGIMTTKFFEALGVEKPVLCVRSDEECLAAVIRDTNAGVAATTAEQVKAFITEKYREWQQNGYTRQAVNEQQRQLFTRQYQAAQFERILMSLIHD
ncbi:MAG: glycosyltransferase [Paludibacteraceae bacterium]|nr:glycosyltransferase [Paludibacteraceae bacterium]